MRALFTALGVAIASGGLCVGVITLAGAGPTQLGGYPLLTLAAALAFAVNLLAWIPASIAQSERFYDLVGSLTFLSLAMLAILASPSPSIRTLCVFTAVICWSLRLGTFLYRRVHQDGGDRRFDEIKRSPASFLTAWLLQALWVFLTLSAALTLRALEVGEGAHAPLRWTDLLGGGLWLFGFTFEVVADRQKRAFRARPESRGRFIQEGLWAWSQHPNYFGEITLWTGISVVASGALAGSGLGVSLLLWFSPLFVALLLTKVSGIPLLAAQGEARWGEEPAYQTYRAQTPRLFPRPPRR